MYRVFNEFFDREFVNYYQALEFARFNACAIYDYESDKILDDYREEEK